MRRYAITVSIRRRGKTSGKRSGRGGADARILLLGVRESLLESAQTLLYEIGPLARVDGGVVVELLDVEVALLHGCWCSEDGGSGDESGSNAEGGKLHYVEKVGSEEAERSDMADEVGWEVG